ncbi:MAG: hypothetical protein ACFFEY_14475 [Candidatus Thorarchaeota archaeon]
MDVQEFSAKLNEVQDLMQKENYKEAISIIDNLKEIEKKGDFNYNLTHRLYQLDSNSRSLYNQQVILNRIKEVSSKYKNLTFRELKEILQDKDDLVLSIDILKREIELLILRNELFCKIENEKIILY